MVKDGNPTGSETTGGDGRRRGGNSMLSANEAAREASKLSREGPSLQELASLARGETVVAVNNLVAGYGNMEILHDFSLRVGARQSLCLVGPNGAGKSTVLHSIYGFTRITSGTIVVNGEDVTRLPTNEKLKIAGIAYILQDNSVFPNMTVEENLLMGGFLMAHSHQAKEAAERVFDKYPQLAERRTRLAAVLSGGERRLLEIARGIMMNPSVLLVDEPSIGLEPRFIEMVFDILKELQQEAGKTVILVEQNAKKGLEFADIGYVLVSGRVAMAGRGTDLLGNPEVGRLFLGG
jgi:branched-chain amino acid transport system ATP-binding protein